MSDADVYPTFTEKDREIFNIQDGRSRADTLKKDVVPKLLKIARIAFGRIKRVYGADPLTISAESFMPDHRPDASKTQSFDAAAAGLVLRRRPVDGKYHYLHLRFYLSKDGFYPYLNASRPVESSALLGILRDNKQNVLQMCEDYDINIFADKMNYETSTNEKIIDSAQIDRGKKWWWSGLNGWRVEYPIDSNERFDQQVSQFVAMFAVFQATCERLSGVEDHFSGYVKSLADALNEERDLGASNDDSGNGMEVGLADSLNPEASAIEGELVQALIRHRRREQRLRDEKIRIVIESTGRLKCEVSGCEFDFFETYGEIGGGFAHVHHLEPLAARLEPSETKMSDLAIVCANCHAMIHRGGIVRPLDTLIKKRNKIT